MSRIAYVLYAHGARDPDWAAPVRAIKQTLEALKPQAVVEVAFLEHMQPTLTAAVASVAKQGASVVIVVPLFFGRGGHLKKDLPEALVAARASNPTLSIETSLAVGEDPKMIRAIADWIAQLATI